MARLRPKVNTEKHYKQESLFTIASGAISNRIIAFAAAVPTGANQVREGASISAVYVELWITTDDAALGSHIVTLEKLSGTSPFMASGDSASLNTYANKKNIFHTQMGLTPPNTQYPMSTVKGWFRIPRGKQRMGLGEQLVLNIHGQSNGLTGCGFFTYKEQF